MLFRDFRVRQRASDRISGSELKIFGICVQVRAWVAAVVLVIGILGTIWPAEALRINNAIQVWGPRFTVDGTRMWNLMGALAGAVTLMALIMFGKFFCRA